MVTGFSFSNGNTPAYLQDEGSFCSAKELFRISQIGSQRKSAYLWRNQFGMPSGLPAFWGLSADNTLQTPNALTFETSGSSGKGRRVSSRLYSYIGSSRALSIKDQVRNVYLRVPSNTIKMKVCSNILTTSSRSHSHNFLNLVPPLTQLSGLKIGNLRGIIPAAQQLPLTIYNVTREIGSAQHRLVQMPLATAW